VLGVLINHPLEGIEAVIAEYKAIQDAKKFNPESYKARPLNGIWATAPYLHNGSVPNIAELLKPPPERVKTFYRGNRHYDEARLGFVSDQPTEGKRILFEYDTRLIGNWNVGHDYGTDLSAAQRVELIAYLKTL